MKIKTATENDLSDLLNLYTYLSSHGNPNPLPIINENIKSIWNKICIDKNHHILMGYENNEAVSTCVLVIIENLTHNQRPYALIENVVTHPDYRRKGYAANILETACRIAEEAGCYKVMLLTGSKKESVLNFYKKAGFNSEDKTAFIKWI